MYKSNGVTLIICILSGLSEVKWSLKNDENWKSEIAPVETHSINFIKYSNISIRHFELF